MDSFVPGTDHNELQPRDPKFSVTPPTRGKWAIIALLVIAMNFALTTLTAGVGYIWLLIIAFIALKAWNKIGTGAAKMLVLDGFAARKLRQDQEELLARAIEGGSFRALMRRLMGMNFDPNRRYFAEAKVTDLDLKSIQTTLRHRILDLVSACLGISFLIAWALKPLFGSNVAGQEKVVVVLVFCVVTSPIIVSWLMPTIWLVQDSGIRWIDNKERVRDLANDIRRGVLSRFFGLAGFIGGFGFFMDSMPEIFYVFEPNGTAPGSAVGNAIVSMFYLLVATLMMSGTALLVAMLYLSNPHEKAVNKFRATLLQYIPAAKTLVHELTPHETRLVEECTHESLDDETVFIASEDEEAGDQVLETREQEYMADEDENTQTELNPDK